MFFIQYDNDPGKLQSRQVYVLNFAFLIFTARNEVGARLCFYRCVWFCSQGGVPVHPPGTRYTPPGPGTPPRDQVIPQPGTPPEQVHPPGQVHPSGPGTPPDQVHPPWDQLHPPLDQLHPRRPGTPPSQAHPPDQV